LAIAIRRRIGEAFSTMNKKLKSFALFAVTFPLCACAPSGSPDPAVKVPQADASGTADLKPLTSISDPRVRQAVAVLAHRQRDFGFAILRATTRNIKSASIGGPVRIPSGPFGYTGADRYCVQADFEPESMLFGGSHGRVFFVEPKGPDAFLVRTSETQGIFAGVMKAEPCGSVRMEPFPELVNERVKFLADG
jgi:hypothetical protein